MSKHGYYPAPINLDSWSSHKRPACRLPHDRLVTIVSPSMRAATDSWCAGNLARLLAPPAHQVLLLLLRRPDLWFPCSRHIQHAEPKSGVQDAGSVRAPPTPSATAGLGYSVHRVNPRVYMTAEPPRLVSVSTDIALIDCLITQRPHCLRENLPHCGKAINYYQIQSSQAVTVFGTSQKITCKPNYAQRVSAKQLLCW